jgi:hypothetical protein
MAHGWTNNKKVRGLKRNIAQAERLLYAQRQLDMTALEDGGYTYVKMTVAPWYNLVKRNPPIWYRRRVLRAMMAVYDAWDEQLQRCGQPYYLKIWLFHPRFWQTQVVAAVGDRIVWYTNQFAASPGTSPGDLLLYDTPDTGINRLHWQPHADEDYFDEDSGYSPQELAQLERQADAVEMVYGRRLFRFRRGTVWLGERAREV